ncbi:MAG: hypothetical protein IPK57_03410 [Chitinophagaceae bacterium]|nr:hypothetical protein [Chitinophagaceae bacterium]
MLMPGRSYTTGNGYRYSINGQENTPEIAPNTTTAEFWQYDARIVRRWNVDPILKEYESPYATFGGNPIINIDPDGSDTINITRKTTFDKRQYRPPSISGNPNSHNRVYDPGNDGITRSGSIEIMEAAGQDIFRITDLHIHIDENGNESTVSSTTTTLELSKISAGRIVAGRNVKGYADDRYALAAHAPRWLLEYYEKKTGGDIGIRSAIAYQKTVPFAHGLGRITNIAYTVAGVYGLARGFLGRNAAGIGFNTFNEFKTAYGTAGIGKAWHHIVEQNPANIAKFGAQRIHNSTNLIKLDHGAGTIHAKVSGYYSSIQPFTNGQTVRKWLSSQSYQQQYDFGIKTMKQFGWTP